MKKLMQQRYQNIRGEEGEGGFTLIELMVVIVILGVLSAIVVFSVGNITDRGEESACQATAKTVEVGSEAFRAAEGATGYAANLQALSPWVRDLPASGNTITTDGGVVTYVAATGAVTNTCA